jgi:Predicted acyltransferases
MVLLLFDLYSNNFIAILTSTLLASSFILFYDQKNKIIYLFENKYFVKLGNISYSFYLWHLPIIYFYDLYFENSIIKIPFIFFLTILLSTISYIFIEKKFRYKKFNLSANQFILPFLISFSAIFIFFYFIAFQKSYENNIKKNIKGLIYSINFLERKIDYSNRVIFYKININGNEVYRFCAQDNTKFKLNNNDLREECLKQGAYKNRLFFVEGNSHTANYIPMLNKVNLKPGDSIYYEHNSEILSNSTTERLNN